MTNDIKQELKIDQDCIDAYKDIADNMTGLIKNMKKELDSDCYFDKLKSYLFLTNLHDFIKTGMRTINSSMLAGYAIHKENFPFECELLTENKHRALSIFEQEDQDSEDQDSEDENPLVGLLKALEAGLSGKGRLRVTKISGEDDEKPEESEVNKKLREELLKKARLANENERFETA